MAISSNMEEPSFDNQIKDKMELNFHGSQIATVGIKVQRPSASAANTAENLLTFNCVVSGYIIYNNTSK